MPGHAGGARVQLRVPVELVDEQGREAPAGMARAPVDRRHDPSRGGRREAERAARLPRQGERLRDLRVQRDVVALARVHPSRPAHRPAVRRRRAGKQEHRPARHAVDEAARPLVLPRRPGVPAQRGDRVQQQQVGVGPRGGAVATRDVHAVVGVPSGRQRRHYHGRRTRSSQRSRTMGSRGPVAVPRARPARARGPSTSIANPTLARPERRGKRTSGDIVRSFRSAPGRRHADAGSATVAARGCSPASGSDPELWSASRAATTRFRARFLSGEAAGC